MNERKKRAIKFICHPMVAFVMGYLVGFITGALR